MSAFGIRERRESEFLNCDDSKSEESMISNGIQQWTERRGAVVVWFTESLCSKKGVL